MKVLYNNCILFYLFISTYKKSKNAKISKIKSKKEIDEFVNYSYPDYKPL